MDFFEFYRSVNFAYFNVFLIAVVTIFSIYRSKRSKWKSFRLRAALFTLLTLCTVFIIEGILIEVYFSIKLESFDLDGDGFFSPEESTDKQKEFFQFMINGTGGGLFILIMPFLSIIYSFLIYIFIFLYELTFKSIFKK